nr:gag pol polyprotein [Hymenolepis microstoma]
MIIQGQSQHRIDDQHERQHRIDDQHERRTSKVMSQPHDLPTMSSSATLVGTNNQEILSPSLNIRSAATQPLKALQALLSHNSCHLNMSKDTESAIPLQTPAFDPENSESWFMQFEMVIRLRGITKRTTWFQHLVPILPTAIVAQFAELTPMPPDNDSYDRLKQAIISRLSVPREKRLDQLFAQVELGDRTPSQLLHYMRSLAIGSPLNDEILKKLWMKCLPKFLIPSLVTSPSRDNLDNLAKEADLIYDLQDGPGINAVKAPTAADSIMQRLNELAEQLQELKASRFSTSPHINRRRPTSPRRWRNPARHTDTVCYYHRMYGYKAKKCQPGCNYSSTDSAFSNLNPTGPERNIIPRSAVKSYLQLTNLTLRPNNNHLSNICTSSSSVHTIKRQNSDMVESTEPNCQQSAAIVSPVKEVDTELLQTDAQEFYEEIPAHSDDFNSIPGDIHNFLTKHPTISTKKRNKRKRKKIAKPIAADHQNISKLFIQNRSPKYKLLLWRLASRRSRLIHAYPTERNLQYYISCIDQPVNIFKNSLALYHTASHRV